MWAEGEEEKKQLETATGQMIRTETEGSQDVCYLGL